MLKPMTASLFALTLFSNGVLAGDDIEKRVAASKAASKAMVTELGGVLKKQIKENGPADAIKVCQEVAPSITNRISNANGWKMTRVSLRYRNSLLGMPDEWEKAVLKKFDERKAAGEDVMKMAYSEVVSDASGERYFRFMKALPTKEVCQTCHGTKDKIPPAVLEKINALYPMDQATGFNKGDVRGAISIKQPLNIPLVGDGVGW